MIPMGRFIDKIGIEIECGMQPLTACDSCGDHLDGAQTCPNHPNATTSQVTTREVVRSLLYNNGYENTFDVTSDGSLRSVEDVTNLVELVSRPVNYNHNELEELPEAVKLVYDYINDINGSMGLHIHFSLNEEKMYNLLATKKFHDFFENRVRNSELYDKSEHLRARVNDEPYGRGSSSNWAQTIEDAKQVENSLNGSETRYLALNYGTHYDTIECRLFPAFHTADDVLKAINLLTSSVNAYIRKTRGEQVQNNVRIPKTESSRIKNYEIKNNNLIEEYNVPA